MPKAYLRVSPFIVDFMPGEPGPTPIWGLDLVLGNMTEPLDGTGDVWTIYQIARAHAAKSGLPVIFDLARHGEEVMNLTGRSPHAQSE
ncbi:MAG: hypothetical protein AB7O49_10130 [Sphingomonadales bacterium]